MRSLFGGCRTFHGKEGIINMYRKAVFERKEGKDECIPRACIFICFSIYLYRWNNRGGQEHRQEKVHKELIVMEIRIRRMLTVRDTAK